MSKNIDWDQKRDLLQAGLEEYIAYYTENDDAVNAEIFSDLRETLTKYKAEGFSAQEVVKRTLMYSSGWSKSSFEEWEYLDAKEKDRAYSYLFLDQYVHALTDSLVSDVDWSNREIILRQYLLKKCSEYDNRSEEDEDVAHPHTKIYVAMLTLMDENSDDAPQQRVEKVLSRISFWHEMSAQYLHGEDEERAAHAAACRKVKDELHTLFEQDAVTDWEHKEIVLRTGLIHQAGAYAGLANLTSEFKRMFTPMMKAFEAMSEEMEAAERAGMSGKRLVEHMSAVARARYKEASRNWSFENTHVRSQAMMHHTVDDYVQHFIYGID